MKLCVRNGQFFYKKQEDVINNVNFEIESGDLLAILGPNGAGKTTLLRCIMGMLKWREGASLLIEDNDERNIKDIPYRELWSKMAYVPQAKSTTLMYSVQEMIMLGRSTNFGVFASPSKQDTDAVKDIMIRLHIDKIADKICSEISGGELQMVLIARALAANPKILILDEPESNLDFKNQLIVLDTMSKLAADGMICVFNTHYPDHALQRANKAIILCKGGEYLFGDTHDVIKEINIQKAFGVQAVISEIETPYSVLADVIPLSIARSDSDNSEISAISDKESDLLNMKKLAVASIIIKDSQRAIQVNEIIHKYRENIIGRMGMPCRDYQASIINITLDATAKELLSMQNELKMLPGVSAKITYAPE